MGKTVRKDIPSRREISHLDASMRHSAGPLKDDRDKRSHNKYLKLLEEETEEEETFDLEAFDSYDFDPDHPKYRTHN